jgi:methyltransferase (TIGR00027 family)
VNPVSNTAFYCCGIRMRDAGQPRPVCGDQFAKLFMNEQALQIFERFGRERAPNASNVARARYIDDLLRARLALNPTLQVVLLGCGFDSRAFRLAGGVWFELDEPALMVYKEERLAAGGARNPLSRVSIEFARESLRDKLLPLAGDAPTVFVIEGVTMYITPESLRGTLEILRSLFPHHEVIVDLMTRAFINTYGHTIKEIIRQLGAEMIPSEQPALPFEQAGYLQISSREIAGLGLRYRSMGWLVPVLRLFMNRLFTGYTVREFRPAAGGA